MAKFTIGIYQDPHAGIQGCGANVEDAGRVALASYTCNAGADIDVATAGNVQTSPMTDGGVVGPMYVVVERVPTEAAIVEAGCLVKERLIPEGAGIAGGGVVKERLITDGHIAGSGVVLKRSLTNGYVLVARTVCG